VQAAWVMLIQLQSWERDGLEVRQSDDP